MTVYFMKNKTYSLLISILFASFVAHSDVLDQSARDTFLAGRTRLSAGFFNTAYTGFDEAKKMIAGEKWPELVDHVLRKKFDADLYYFLLGRAAEGMGAKSAAMTYYDLALRNEIKCSSYIFGDGCMGLKFPSAISERLEIISNSSQGKVTKWGIGTGPLISEISQAKRFQIIELSNINSKETAAKGKFETEEEFSARGGAKAIERLLVFKLPTDDAKRCNTSYDHTAAAYVINRCQALSGQFPVLRKNETGEPITLANMVDRRDIKRNLNKTYYLNLNFSWSAEFPVSREVAAAIDDDLMIGVQFGKFAMTTECAECDERQSKASTANLISSIGALQGKTIDTSDVDWKKDAFRTGSIDESWVYRINPEKADKIIIFRNSDGRVIFELIPE